MQRVNVHNLINKLPPYQGNEKLLERRQDTYDIIREILKKHAHTRHHYDAICSNHWSGNARDTARNLFNFLKNNVGYVVEKTTEQTVKTPAAILHERHGDCKHYASYIVGICEALRRKGYPIHAFYRFASYNSAKKSPGHVFAIVTDGRNHYHVDPVLTNFDQRSPAPVYHIDRTPPAPGGIGELYDISGIPGNQYVGRHGHWLDALHIHHIPAQRGKQHMHRPHWLDTMPTSRGMIMHGTTIGKKHKAKKAKKKKHGLHIKLPHIKIQPGKLLMKVGGAVPRNAFLGLVKVNMFQMAVKMHAGKKLLSPAYRKLMDKWKKLGGNGNKLNTAIDQGVNNYNRHHAKKITGLDDLYDDEINGMDNVGVVAAVGILAAAAPILAALKDILKSLGIDQKKAQADADDATNTLAHNHNKHGDDTDSDGVTTHDDGTQTSVTTDPDTGQQVLNIHKTAADDNADDGGADDGGGDTTAVATKTTSAPADNSDDSDGGGSVMDTVKAFITHNKKYFIIGGIAVGAFIIIPIVVRAVRGKKTTRRR